MPVDVEGGGRTDHRVQLRHSSTITVSVSYLLTSESEDLSPPEPAHSSELARMWSSADALLDPQVVLDASKDSTGQVVDFIYREVNRAACVYLGLSREGLIGRGLVETMPGIKATLLPRYMRCLETGEPVMLDDFSYDNEILADTRRYDLRATRATPTTISLTWRDVTERFDAAQRAQLAEERFHLLMDIAAIGMCVVEPDGRFEVVNPAMCEFFGLDAAALKQLTWQNLTAPGENETDLANIAKMVSGEIDGFRLTEQFIHSGGDLIWGDVSAGCLRKPNGDVDRFVAQIVDITAAKNATEKYRLLAENATDVVVHLRDDRFVWVSPTIEEVLGAPAAYWIGREVQEILPAEDVGTHAARVKTLARGDNVQGRARVKSRDGVTHWIHLHAKPFYDADDRRDGVSAAFRVIDAEVAAEDALELARSHQEQSDARYRRSMETAAIGMCLLTPDGAITEVNPALCQLLGYDEEALLQKTWQELTPPEYLAVGNEERRELAAGERDSFRIVKKLIRSDGQRIWADVSVSCVRDANGNVEALANQTADITAEVEAREQLARSDEEKRVLAQRLKSQSDRLSAEMESAAGYMASIMPTGLTGAVTVTSRYLPSRELGGDCFEYIWADDDHLLVYLIDVSGHGVEPALLSVSVHNMIRSGSLGPEAVLEPEVALTELNRLFQMDQQRDHYFTMWYGVYQVSTRTLRYVNAGAPRALMFEPATSSGVNVTELPSTSEPVGMFEDTVFTSCDYLVPPGCRFLIYSDGASEIELTDGRQLSPADFMSICTEVVGSPDKSLDDLVAELRALTRTGSFDDDCSMIQLTFN